MNKKFLSAILFGALMVGTAGTFTSCKDYDDDIDQINKELADINSKIAALQSAVDNGKWITSVTPSADGLVITMNDGQTFNITNGKDGANGVDGAAGAAGTEWTISEDGFWVCNGEKTDVKAVGQNGEKGEAGQQEVKFEDGKWFLWNGTEFVEFKGAAATGNVPYYYTDPNDQNYAILVVFDKDGQNMKEIRLPMNSGLAQIKVLGSSQMIINYHRYNGTAKWNGDKPLPAKGEYLITQPNKSFIIQVTPTNYDLAALDLKLVNAKGEEAPVILGEPTPYEGYLGVQSRAVSESGIFEVTVAPKDFSAETIQNWEDNFKYQGLSLVANESVRSTYCASLRLANVTSVPSILWGNYYSFDAQGNATTVWEYTQNLNQGNEITLAPKYHEKVNGDDRLYPADEYIYDAFVTMASGSKADSIKAGVDTDGVKITAKSACRLLVDVNYVNAIGQVKKYPNVVVEFYDGYIAPEIEDFTLDAVTHQTVTKQSKQTQLVDFSAYFTKYANDETSRILWNADATLAAGGQVEINGDTYANVYATWEHENEYGDIVTEEISDLVNSIVLCDKDGKNEGVNAKATHLNVKFKADYGSTIIFEKGKVTVYATVNMKQANGNYEPVQTIAIPVTLKNPAAADIAATYAFNPADFKDNTLTVLDATTVNVPAKLTKGTLDFTSESLKYDKNSITVTSAGVVTLKDSKNMGKSYTISGVKTKCLNRPYDVSFAVKFVNSKSYELVVPKALSVACAGANEIKVKYGDLVKNDGYTYNYKLTNFAGVLVPAADISNVEFFADKDYKVAMSALDIVPDANKNLTIKSTGDKIANDITVTVYAKFTVTGEAEPIKMSFNVTVTSAL